MLCNNFDFKWMNLLCYNGRCSGIGVLDYFFTTRNREKIRLDNTNHGSQPCLPGCWWTKNVACDQYGQICIMHINLNIFSSLYQGIDPISLIHVYFKFMNFSRPKSAIKGQKNFLPYVPKGHNGLATKTFLPSVFLCAEMFFLFLKNRFLARAICPAKNEQSPIKLRPMICIIQS